MPPLNFDTAFHALTGNPPFPWQQALHERFVSDRTDNIPASCNLPTGLGKTSVIAVWLIALANGAKVPRRLVYVVNRRTVVDQTTTEVENLRKRLPDVQPVWDALWEMCAVRPEVIDPEKDRPLAISTLRGQFADNREWSADPSRPAVICGTVDMIGSRLLFSGYGCGFKTRPLHAGFLGQDALIVHDEAHLEPAFQCLIEDIRDEQKREPAPLGDWTRLKVMELTATSRAGTGDVFELTPEEKNPLATIPDPPTEPIHHAWRRQKAKKALHLHENKDEKKFTEEIAELALKYKDSGRAILVFVRKVDDVAKIVAQLTKAKQHVQQLTGTLRGLERDRMADPRRPDGCAIFARFLKPPKPDAPESERWKVEPKSGTVYLICTSAGEVGVNISADHLVCDLSTFESMAQRFGRVNRFGDRPDTEIHVVYPKEFDEEKPPEPQMEATLALLRKLPKRADDSHDASPAALGNLDPDERKAAFAPTPTILPTSDILFDAWALTTINKPLVKQNLPGRPPVEPYLHGVATWQPPETHVAWREEVERITGALLEEHEPEELLDAYPLKPHELLRDNSGRVYDRLKKLEAKKTLPVWLVADDDSVEVTTLGDLIDAGKEKIEHQTVLLPPNAGGLAGGFIDPDSRHADDVSDKWFADEAKAVHRRVRVWDGDRDKIGNEMRLVLTIDTKPDAEEAEEAIDKRFWHWYELRFGGDDEGIRNSKKPVSWDTHTGDVVCHTKAIVGSLPLGTLRELIVLAAECHDFGKRRKLFQTVLGNRDYPSKVLAKSGKKGGRIEERYRHEFGSLIDIVSPERNKKFAEFDALNDDLKAFVLHMIAAHHGRGRPHFPADEAFDPEGGAEVARAVARGVPQRFARLQRKYGRWGLAYLESLLRAADYAASASPSKFEEEAP
jgi:CRISPR-associated endonuclease/helicase Cas3